MKLSDQRIIEDYFSRERVRRFHIGCGSNLLQGWLNTDQKPLGEAICLDATEPFPFGNDQFDYVFSEHVIEHFEFQQCAAMLLECHRTLKPGGVLRISTPDLSFLIELYKDEKSELHAEYIKWSTDNFIPDAPYYGAAFVVNNFVRDWGHTFIYDEGVIRYALTKAGFGKITKCAVNESAHSELRKLENDDRMPVAFLKLESLILEATKPELPQS